MMVVRGCRVGAEMGYNCLMGKVFYFVVIKMLQDEVEVVVNSTVNVLYAIELFTLKLLILCSVHFTSVKKKL